MSAEGTIKRAAQEAARYALPSLPLALVSWDDEPPVQGEASFPSVTLKPVSHVKEHPRQRVTKAVREDGRLDRSLSQLYRLRVQFTIEGWLEDSTGRNKPVEFTRRMVRGWEQAAARAALLDRDTPESQRTRVVMVGGVGDITPMSVEDAGGYVLPVYVYEIEFRYVDHDVDPQPADVIEQVLITGTLRQATTPHPNDVEISLLVPEE